MLDMLKFQVDLVIIFHYYFYPFLILPKLIYFCNAGPNFLQKIVLGTQDSRNSEWKKSFDNSLFACFLGDIMIILHLNKVML